MANIATFDNEITHQRFSTFIVILRVWKNGGTFVAYELPMNETINETMNGLRMNETTNELTINKLLQ